MKSLFKSLFRPKELASATEETWFSGEREHEGLPLFLRFPEERNYKILEKEYPILTVIEHHLSSVKSNGLPQTEYNESLEELDAAITEGMDCIVLVETYAGKRTYYGYSKNKEKASGLFDSIASSFPAEKLVLETSQDKKWNFIKQYSADFEFYGKKR